MHIKFSRMLSWRWTSKSSGLRTQTKTYNLHGFFTCLSYSDKSNLRSVQCMCLIVAYARAVYTRVVPRHTCITTCIQSVHTGTRALRTVWALREQRTSRERRLYETANITRGFSCSLLTSLVQVDATYRA